MAAGSGTRAPAVRTALSRRFRAAQSAAGDAAGNAAARLWAAGFDIGDARGSWKTVRPHVAAVARRGYAAAEGSARTYYDAVRIANGLGPIPDAAARRATVPLDDGRLAKTIDSTGPGMFLHYVAGGAQMADANDSARAKLASAVGALVMSGARDWLYAAARADPAALGVRRVAAGTCDYCQGLLDLGVALPDGGGGFHDNCDCTNEPVFSPADAGPSDQPPEPAAEDTPLPPRDCQALLGAAGNVLGRAYDAAADAADDAAVADAQDQAQAVVAVMQRPPQPGDPGYDRFRELLARLRVTGTPDAAQLRALLQAVYTPAPTGGQS